MSIKNAYLANVYAGLAQRTLSRKNSCRPWMKFWNPWNPLWKLAPSWKRTA